MKVSLVYFCVFYEESANWTAEDWKRWKYYSQKANVEKQREQKAIASELKKQKQKSWSSPLHSQ